jgi:uncharacterized protein DUF4124
MRKLIHIFFITLFFATAVDADIYKWVDENGITQYSDSPPPGRRPQKLETAPVPSKEEIEKAMQRRGQILEEERLRAGEKHSAELEEAKNKQEGAKIKRDAGACVRTLLSLCDGQYKSKEYLYFCTDLNKYYRIDNCTEPVDAVIGKTQAMFRACEKDYGEYCIQSTDRQPGEGVECLARHRTRISSQCLGRVEGLFRHIAIE